MAEGNVTTDHEKIRKWAEERGGKPSTVKGTSGTRQKFTWLLTSAE